MSRSIEQPETNAAAAGGKLGMVAGGGVANGQDRRGRQHRLRKAGLHREGRACTGSPRGRGGRRRPCERCQGRMGPGVDRRTRRRREERRWREGEASGRRQHCWIGADGRQGNGQDALHDKLERAGVCGRVGCRERMAEGMGVGWASKRVGLNEATRAGRAQSVPRREAPSGLNPDVIPPGAGPVSWRRARSGPPLGSRPSEPRS